MKIAQVCPYDFSRPGGVKNHIENLTKFLNLEGHKVIVIAPPPDVGHSNVYHFGVNRSIDIWGTRIDINIAVGKESKTLKAFLKKENFDIIHYHTFWNPILPYQIWRNSKAKNIATFHDTPKSKWIGKTIMPLAASLVIKMMDQAISVSETQARYINGLENPKVHILPNGINLSDFNQPIEPISKYRDGKFNLLFLGRLEPRKGVIYALESFRTLKNKDDQLRLIIAGDGQEKILIESYIKKHQLKDVELLGGVDEATKLSLLKSCDLYLAPAIFGESFGIVLLEAMASSLPIVGFGNEGYLNIIPEQWRSYFPPPKDQGGLTKAISTLKDNQPYREKMIQWGLEEVKKYDWKILVSEVELIYNKVLK